MWQSRWGGGVYVIANPALPPVVTARSPEEGDVAVSSDDPDVNPGPAQQRRTSESTTCLRESAGGGCGNPGGAVIRSPTTVNCYMCTKKPSVQIATSSASGVLLAKTQRGDSCYTLASVKGEGCLRSSLCLRQTFGGPAASSRLRQVSR